MTSRSDRRPPWKRKNPKKRSKRLSPEQKSEARARARTAGRKYPNHGARLGRTRDAGADR